MLGYVLLIGFSILTVILLIVFVKRAQVFQAFISVMLMHLIDWPLGLLVVQAHLISYPENFLKASNPSNFLFEYFMLPAVSAMFNLHFPKNSGFARQCAYVLSISGPITLLEVILERNTDLIHYIRWNWACSFATLNAVLLLSYWFFCMFLQTAEKNLTRM